METWPIILFSLQVALLSTLCIFPLGLAAGWLLARHCWPGKSLIETLIALPMVIPPVATGLILLKLLGQRGVIGSFLQKNLGVEIVFTWKAVLIAVSVMSFPLFVRTVRVAFEEVNPRLEQMALTLGASPWRVFFTISIPLATRGIVAGAVLAFARALGEFGATVVLAGNIPGKTSTLSLSIYQMIQLGQDQKAFQLLLVSVLIAFGAIWSSEWILRRTRA